VTTELDVEVAHAIAGVRSAGESAAVALDRLAAAATVDLAGAQSNERAPTSSRAQLLAAWREWRHAEHAEVVARDVLAELLAPYVRGRSSASATRGEIGGQVRHCDRPMSKESTRFTSRSGKAYTTIELRCVACPATVTLDLVEHGTPAGSVVEEPPTIPNLKSGIRLPADEADPTTAHSSRSVSAGSL